MFASQDDYEYSHGLYVPRRRVLRPKQLIPGVVAGGMAAAGSNLIAVLQTQTAQTSGSGTTFQGAAMGSALTNPSTLVVGIWLYDHASESTVLSVTDTAGNTYASDVVNEPATGDYNTCEIWRATNTHTTASNKITVTTNASVSNIIFSVIELSNVKSASPVDATINTNKGNGTSPSVGPFTTTNAFDILLMVASVQDTASPTTPAGFTSIGKNFGDFCRKLVSTTQSGITPAWTESDTGWTTCAVALKSA